MSFREKSAWLMVISLGLASVASGYVSAAGVGLSLTLYLLMRNGDALFYGVFGSWVLAQLSEYSFELALYRRGV